MTEPQKLLSMLFGMWKQVGDETVRSLGEETAGLFLHLADDAQAIRDAILDAYPQDELVNSLVFIEFAGALKELGWLHAMFLCGNYPLALSRLRFNGERIFRARHADLYALDYPNETDGPGPTADDKHAWLTAREKSLDWRDLIAPTLKRLFASDDPSEIESHFKPLWQGLHRCVHPSGELREKLMTERGLMMIDAFDEGWARQTHAAAAEVFALVWLAVLSRFPAAVPALLADAERFRTCPQLGAALEAWQEP